MNGIPDRLPVAAVLGMLAVLLASCYAIAPTSPVPVTAGPTRTSTASSTAHPPTVHTPTPLPTGQPYPPATQPGTGSPYPAPITIPVPVIYAAQTMDAELSRGQVFLDSADVLTMESFPPQFALTISGNLPTPCHQLRIEILPPDDAGVIAVSVYSLVNDQIICTQVLESFAARLPLAGMPPGDYAILVNGDAAGTINVP